MPKTFIPKTFSQSMRKATRLTGMGKLLEATRLIQRTLAAAPTVWPSADTHPQPIIILPGPERSAPDLPKQAPQQTPQQTPQFTSRQPARHAPPSSASFAKQAFSFAGASYPYRLYIPPALESGSSPAGSMPLVVLLHGCQQDALDFSNGTAMNALADTHQVMVLYPEQITSGNAMRCWNWFEPGHQKADRGEPGMIAALTQKIVQQHGADPHRVYIAGLSAGGAMAAVVASLNPGIYAAVGVHSGLAAGAARDVASAFKAMRSGAKGRTLPAIPTIVFHGTADKTVHPDNADHIADAALAALKAAGVELVKTKDAPGTQGTEKTDRVVYSSASGKPLIENWRIDAGPHAWSGGDAAGSYTDPEGPSASAAMLAFFLQHRLGA